METGPVRSPSAGVNQQGLRDHNERLILSILQRSGPLPGIDVARGAGLSAQTVSVILRGLEAEGLVRRGEPQRGRVGKPRTPMGLDPEGVFSVGLKIALVSQVVNNSCCPVDATRIARRSSSGK